MKTRLLVAVTTVVLLVAFGALMRLAVAGVGLTIDQALERDSHDVQRQRARLAAHDTAVYIDKYMAATPTFPDKFALLDRAVESVDPKLSGLWAEFGVYTGGTVNHLASRTAVVVHGFDSFEGLPETWRTGFEKGAFGMSGLPKVRDNVRLHKGWFNESVPKWSEEHQGPMALMHLDADLYSSTKCVFDLLGDRIVPGTVLVFDEFFNYPGWQQGEFKAFQELVQARGATVEYLGYSVGGDAQQVALRVLSVGGGATAAPPPEAAASTP